MDQGVPTPTDRPCQASAGSAPTQLPELRERVQHGQAVSGLALHHGVQSQVHVPELRQGAQPQHFRQRGHAVVVEAEMLQGSQVLNPLSWDKTLSQLALGKARNATGHHAAIGPSTSTRTEYTPLPGRATMSVLVHESLCLAHGHVTVQGRQPQS